MSDINRLIVSNGQNNFADDFIRGNLARKRGTAFNDNHEAGVLNNVARQNAITKTENVNRLLGSGATPEQIMQIDPATANQMQNFNASVQKQSGIDKNELFQNLGDFGYRKTQQLFPDATIDPSFSVFDNGSPEQLALQERFKKGSGITINNGPTGQPLAESRAEKLSSNNRAIELGIPKDIRAPWESVNDSKKRDDARIKFGASSQATLAKDIEKLEQVNNVLDKVDRFLFLNEGTSTGKISGLPLVKDVREAVSPEFQEMSSITDALTPLMRQGMPGAASDRDVSMFRGAGVGVGKDEEVNKKVGLGLKVARQNFKDRNKFMNDFYSSYGHLQGADSKWNEYLEANPIFDSEKPTGSFELNPVRQSYKDYFSGNEAPQRQAEDASIDDLVNKYAN